MEDAEEYSMNSDEVPAAQAPILHVDANAELDEEQLQAAVSATAELLKGRTELGEMRLDPLVAKFAVFESISVMEEKTSDPKYWTKGQRTAHRNGNWKEFSRLRGYWARA